MGRLSFRCADCGTSYHVTRERIPPAGATIGCKRCGRPLGLRADGTIDGGVVDPAADPAPDAPSVTLERSDDPVAPAPPVASALAGPGILSDAPHPGSAALEVETTPDRAATPPAPAAGTADWTAPSPSSASRLRRATRNLPPPAALHDFRRTDARKRFRVRAWHVAVAVGVLALLLVVAALRVAPVNRPSARSVNEPVRSERFGSLSEIAPAPLATGWTQSR